MADLEVHAGLAPGEDLGPRLVVERSAEVGPEQIFLLGARHASETSNRPQRSTKSGRGRLPGRSRRGRRRGPPRGRREAPAASRYGTSRPARPARMPAPASAARIGSRKLASARSGVAIGRRVRLVHRLVLGSEACRSLARALGQDRDRPRACRLEQDAGRPGEPTAFAGPNQTTASGPPPCRRRPRPIARSAAACRSRSGRRSRRRSARPAADTSGRASRAPSPSRSARRPGRPGRVGRT